MWLVVLSGTSPTCTHMTVSGQSMKNGHDMAVTKVKGRTQKLHIALLQQGTPLTAH